MTDKILEAAVAEADSLRADIEKIPTVRRLRVLEKFIGEYRSISQTEPRERYRPRESALKYGRPGSVASIIIQASEAYLKKVNRRAMSGEITNALREGGIKITGQNAVSTLSSYLSTCDLFDNVKGQGYGLKEWKGSLPDAEHDHPANGQLRLNG